MRITAIIISIIICSAISYAADYDKASLELIKKLFEQSSGEGGLIKAGRFFQFTATKEKDNFLAYFFNSENTGIDEKLKELGLKKSDKGRYLPAIKDRSPARVMKLWKNNRVLIMSLIESSPLKKDIADRVSGLISFHDSYSYAAAIAKMKETSPQLDMNTLDAAEAATREDYSCFNSRSGYYSCSRDALAFWYRRTVEKNDTAVYSILKDIQSDMNKRAKTEEDGTDIKSDSADAI